MEDTTGCPPGGEQPNINDQWNLGSLDASLNEILSTRRTPQNVSEISGTSSCQPTDRIPVTMEPTQGTETTIGDVDLPGFLMDSFQLHTITPSLGNVGLVPMEQVTLKDIENLPKGHPHRQYLFSAGDLESSRHAPSPKRVVGEQPELLPSWSEAIAEEVRRSAESSPNIQPAAEAADKPDVDKENKKGDYDDWIEIQEEDEDQSMDEIKYANEADYFEEIADTEHKEETESASENLSQ